MIQLFIAGFGLKIGNHQILKGCALVADGLALLEELGEQVGQRGHQCTLKLIWTVIWKLDKEAT